MLWTIMQEDTVLVGIDQQRDYQYKQYLGKNVIVESQDNGKEVIVQLLSTDPNDFLNQFLSPGKELMKES
ncbi:MAG: YlzJ-like family protein [Dehalobacterium sp.]